MTPSSSSSHPYERKYDVFLNFRGSDTRCGFTGHLYNALRIKGIKVFFDEEELEKGEEINPALDKAIRESRIAIIIFSKNYASSIWCLEELAKVMEYSNDKAKRMLVLPVFYLVNPCDVRHKKGSYAKALAKHEARCTDKGKIDRWRLALSKAADLSGFPLKPGQMHEHKLIDQIVQSVSEKISSLLDGDKSIGQHDNVVYANIYKFEDSNEVIQHVPTHTTSAHAQGSNVEEARPSPSYIEGATYESIQSQFITSKLDVEVVQAIREPKQHRGPTRMLDICEMEEGECILVELDRDGRPIGEGAATLTRFIDNVIRRQQYAFINYKSWKEMTKEHKEEMLKILEAKFKFVSPINDETREMLKTQLNEKWRQWQADLKSMAYDPSKIEEQVISTSFNDRVDPSPYRELVHYPYSEDGQKISGINRQNRAKYEDVHCMQTKSFPKLIDEKEKKTKGMAPNRKDIYNDIQTHKDGTIVNEKEELNKYNNNEVGSSHSGKQYGMPWKDDIFFKVKGHNKKRRVCSMGKMPKSKKMKGSLSENQELPNRLKHMESMMTTMVTFIQSRFSGEDVNDVINAAKQVQDASSTLGSLSSSNSDTDEDNEYGDD